MEITASNMSILFTGISTQFKDAFARFTDESWKQFAYLQPMATGVIEMPFLEQIAGMREWVGLHRRLKGIPSAPESSTIGYTLRTY